MKRGTARAAVCLVALALGACGVLSVQEEKQLGHRVQRQVQQELQLMREPVIVNFVREIGGRVAAAARTSAFDFRFYVVESEEINAFAIPGGAIYVHTGLITAAKSEAEVAGVLAHEIGHVTARHVAKMYNRQRNTGIISQIVTFAIAILTGSQYIAQGGALATDVAATAYLNTYTQDAEREADQLAVETMLGAHYEPNALVTMFQTLQAEAAGGMGLPQFLKSHPATTERIRNVQLMIRQAGPASSVRGEDGRMAIIQRRIDLVVGTDLEVDPDEEFE